MSLLSWFKKFLQDDPLEGVDDDLHEYEMEGTNYIVPVPGINLNLDGSFWSHPGDVEANNGCPFPHCDAQVLHTPGNCEHCDKFPGAQYARKHMRVAYTDTPPEIVEAEGLMACPAITRRGEESINSWFGNRAAKS